MLSLNCKLGVDILLYMLRLRMSSKLECCQKMWKINRILENIILNHFTNYNLIGCLSVKLSSGFVVKLRIQS